MSLEQPKDPLKDTFTVTGGRDIGKQVTRLKNKLLAAVSEIIGRSYVLVDTANEISPSELAARELLTDLESTIQTSKQTYKYIQEELGVGFNLADHFLGIYRDQQHKILNLVNQLKGFTFLMLHKEVTQQFPLMKAALESINSRCDEIDLVMKRFYEHIKHQDDEAPKTLPDVESDIIIPTQTGSVLVVDDDSNFRYVLTSILENYGFTPTGAANGREALATLKKCTVQNQFFDLIILDLLMDDITGFEIMDFMKENPELASIPVIIVSGLNEPKLIAQCISSGADEFITKPIDNYLLLSRINACMEKQRLKEKEYAQFFPPALAKDFARNPKLKELANDAEVSILFADIRGFSAISEKLNPADGMEWLGDVLGCLSDCIQDNDGVVLDYIGDEIMGMWGAPYPDPRHAELACQAAIEMLDRLPQKIDPKWQHFIPEGTRIGIGINSGVARVGNTGSDRRFKYGATGNTVNLASRIQGSTKYLRTPFVISKATKDKLGKSFHPRRLCSVQVVNVEQPVHLYELVCDSSKMKIVGLYENALQLFEQQRLKEATSALAELLSEQPDDGPALLLMSKIVDVLINKDAQFSPVIKLPGK